MAYIVDHKDYTRLMGNNSRILSNQKLFTLWLCGREFITGGTVGETEDTKSQNGQEQPKQQHSTNNHAHKSHAHSTINNPTHLLLRDPARFLQWCPNALLIPTMVLQPLLPLQLRALPPVLSVSPRRTVLRGWSKHNTLPGTSNNETRLI